MQISPERAEDVPVKKPFPNLNNERRKADGSVSLPSQFMFKIPYYCTLAKLELDSPHNVSWDIEDGHVVRY